MAQMSQRNLRNLRLLTSGLLVPVAQLFPNIFKNVMAFSVAMKLPVHALQSNTNDIAVVKFRTEIVAQLEPHVVHQVYIFRPQARWMRSKVDKDRGTARGNDFK